MLIDQGLELLTEEESRRLLRMGDVGRVGLTVGALPTIFPVNYGVIDGAVVFRTAPGSKLAAAARGAIVAFEVDDYERANRTGWSVLVIGRSEVVHDLDSTYRVLDAHIAPWAGGVRSSIVRIHTELISGRRII